MNEIDSLASRISIPIRNHDEGFKFQVSVVGSTLMAETFEADWDLGQGLPTYEVWARFLVLLSFFALEILVILAETQ